MLREENYINGWNLAIDACKKAYDEAQTSHCKDCCCARAWEALGVKEYTGKSNDIATDICLRFSSPSVPSVDDIKRIIKKVLLGSCTCNDGNGIVCAGCFYRHDLAQAIHNKLKERK